ncbi:Mur ligase family protein, partial [Bacillus solimangrovi]|uniref:Mur ligase family protein n=1 Tax=Bacillus solimangrovi TaxID=1305675 RepID=UPI000ACCA79C
MNVSLKQISDVLEQFRGAIDEGICIHEVYIDSRQTVNKGLFVPIIGDRFDGHEFLMDAIEHGAIAAIWDKQKEVPSFVPNDFPLFMVDNTIEGLQTIAKQYLQLIQPNVIAITGSNGKTTTKDFVDSVMKKKYKTHKTAGNFNNHIGLPLTVLSMPEDTEVLILEMGMSGLGEISLLSNLAEPDVAIAPC